MTFEERLAWAIAVLNSHPRGLDHLSDDAIIASLNRLIGAPAR